MSKKASGGRLSGGGGPGGGIGSRATHAPTTYFTGQPSTRINPGGASQNAYGNHSDSPSKTSNYRGEPMRQGAVGGPGSTKLGNECALDVGGGGPGKGRVVMPAGGQGTHGPVNPGNPPPKGELFPGWPAKR
jgi:hypothetical protein